MGMQAFKSLIRTGALALALAASAQATRAESLTDALIAAYKHSNLLEQQRALLRAADEDVVQARAGLLPVVNFLGNVTYTDDSEFTGTPTFEFWTAFVALNAELTVYDNGVTKYATDAAKETVLGLRGALLQVEQDVLLGAVVAYMDMIESTQSVQLQRNNVRLITQELRAARDRFEVGEVTRTDVSLAEARLAAARGALAASIGTLEVARETYKARVGHYPGNLRWPTTPRLAARTEDKAKAVAVRTHPSILQQQHNVNAAEAIILRAKAALGPRVVLEATARVDEEYHSTLQSSATLSVPIYSGGTLRSAIRQAVANRDGSRAGLLQTVVGVKLNVGTAWANLSVAAAQTEAARRQVRASEVAYRGVREEAKFGARTTLDVLDAEQELLDARNALIEAEVQQYVSTYTLLSSMGLMTAKQLGLGIVTYDPIEYYNHVNGNGRPKAVVSSRGQALDRVLRSLGGGSQ